MEYQMTDLRPHSKKKTNQRMNHFVMLKQMIETGFSTF